MFVTKESVQYLTFCTEIDGTKLCFSFGEKSSGQRSEQLQQLVQDAEEVSIILPLQARQDNSNRFKWAMGYHFMELELSCIKKHILHCWSSTTGVYTRGFLLSSSVEPVLLELEETGPFQRLRLKAEGTKWLVSCKETDMGELHVEPFPSVHPAFQKRENNTLFHSLTDTHVHLKDWGVATFPGVLEVLSFTNILQVKKQVLFPEDDEHEPQKPFIVIEGLDGTGKSTLAKKLADKLDAEMFNTPPTVIRHVRPIFDSIEIHSTMMKKVYYSIGNYITLWDIEKTLQQRKRPVVMDRFWHSTAAYAIATECESGDETSLPPEGHWVYEWPSDILTPDLVILLTVSENIREQRINSRNAEQTVEEEHIARDTDFRKRIIGAYKRMTGPVMAEIDANGDQDQVEKAALLAISERGLNGKK